MRILTLTIAAIVAALLLAHFAPAADPPAKKLNVVIVTGGHGFDTKAFPNLFAGYDDINFEYKDQKDDSELFEDISNWKYDVMVFYNMGQKISEKRQANFIKLMDQGVGVVALHHCIGAYQDWPEWPKIIGGKFFTKEGTIYGKNWPVSLWKDDVEMTVHVEADHPITAGVKDFAVTDESYKNQWHNPDAKLLLSTDEATQDKQLAWAKTYRKSNVCFIQLGHGPGIYSDANYRKLVSQAIRWAAPKQ